MTTTKSERCPGSGNPPDFIGKRTGKGGCDHCYGKYTLRKDGMLPVHKRWLGPPSPDLKLLSELTRMFVR